MSGKIHESKELDDSEGGEYEAAVNQEKEDDRWSHREFLGRTLAQQLASGSEQEEVIVAVLNVRTWYLHEKGKENTFSWQQLNHVDFWMGEIHLCTVYSSNDFANIRNCQF